MEIPQDRLKAEVLNSIIEEFVLREGTDYGGPIFSLEQKITQVREQLNSGQAYVAFDPETETCTILLR